MLVEQGLYATRTDFIRTGIRRLLEANESVLADTISRQFLNVGMVWLNQKDLLAMQAKGERLRIRSIGRLVLNVDVDPDTAGAVIEEIMVKGSLKMSPEVRARLADRIHA